MLIQIRVFTAEICHQLIRRLHFLIANSLLMHMSLTISLIRLQSEGLSVKKIYSIVIYRPS